MSFDEQFELGELLRDDGVRTFLVHHKTGLAHSNTGSARDPAPGQSLLAHFLDNWEETAQLLASLDGLPEPERRRIVERGERGGTPYVVTDSLSGHPGFREWLAVSSQAASGDPVSRDAVSRNETRSLDSAGAWRVILPERSPEPSPLSSPEPSPVSSIDEQFFSLFPTAERPQAAPNQAWRSPSPSPSQSQSPGPAAANQSPSQSQSSVPAAPYQSPYRPSGERAEPGEVTRLFQAPSEPPLPPPKKPGGTG